MRGVRLPGRDEATKKRGRAGVALGMFGGRRELCFYDWL